MCYRAVRAGRIATGASTLTPLVQVIAMLSHQVTESPQPHSRTMVGVTIWRMVVAWCALYGFDRVTNWPMWGIDLRPLYELSQLSSLVVGLSYLGLAAYPLFVAGRRHEPASGWLRGALAVVMLLVCLTSILFLGGGNLTHPGFLFEHLVTPVVVVVDFLFVGRNQERTRWWHPLSWVVLPLAYFVFLLSTGVRSYRNLFAPSNDDFAVTVAGFFVGVIAVGYLLHGLVRARSALTRR